MRVGSTSSIKSTSGPRSQLRPPPYAPWPKPCPFLPPRSPPALLAGVPSPSCSCSSAPTAPILRSFPPRPRPLPRPRPSRLPRPLTRSRICKTIAHPLLGPKASHSCAVKLRFGSVTSMPLIITCAPPPEPPLPALFPRVPQLPPRPKWPRARLPRPPRVSMA